MVGVLVELARLQSIDQKFYQACAATRDAVTIGLPFRLLTSRHVVSQDDIPTARTPKRRHIEVPPQATIESLRAPDFSSLVEDFRGKQAQDKPLFLPDGSVKPESRIPCPPNSKSQEGLDRSESRIPFAALCSN